MERSNSKEWIKELKSAILNENLVKIGEFSKRRLPQFSSVEEAKEAFSLMKKARDLLIEEQRKVAIQMQELKETNRQIEKYQMENQNISTSEWKC